MYNFNCKEGDNIISQDLTVSTYLEIGSHDWIIYQSEKSLEKTFTSEITIFDIPCTIQIKYSNIQFGYFMDNLQDLSLFLDAYLDNNDSRGILQELQYALCQKLTELQGNIEAGWACVQDSKNQEQNNYINELSKKVSSITSFSPSNSDSIEELENKLNEVNKLYSIRLSAKSFATQ